MTQWQNTDTALDREHWLASTLTEEAHSENLTEDPIRYRTIWISDCHLGSKGCKADFLSDFLKQHDCEKLILNGDIIDGWRMRKKIHWPQAHTNVIRRILTRAKRGTQVIYITGNHDDMLRRYSGIDFGNIHLVDEHVHITADGKKLWCIHGDQFDGVIQCHRWLAFVGDFLYETVLTWNRWFNKARARLGFGYWSLSAYLKHKVKRAVNFISDFEHAVAKSGKQKKMDGVVCGHIHHAEIREMEDGVMYFNSGDWVESCTALAEDFDGRIHLIRWIDIDHQSVKQLTAQETSAEAA
ncbi:UDP-2,3-diacylglucosamine diphosphatase [Thiomicrorhabdus xiamenensis]|uniref:UDP-2,3-diacylglucosamine diphosphatase n=1 Tax=Thiomicrorhabdus xiamenensis TaxID=2739063 RepID=A0A7D4TFI4_9GAMM|nr:UDP-2,3-diacylglucosamine diphosphatase [Thiomicrorhabdus xiamenensis]QKI90067.1 UDP-2,3-diacylglucosamine diphosphatase [Thiomicrorhabdus xiamenensis]